MAIAIGIVIVIVIFIVIVIDPDPDLVHCGAIHYDNDDDDDNDNDDDNDEDNDEDEDEDEDNDDDGDVKSMEDILRVSSLSKSFPGVRALEAVDLAVAPGTVHALMGENGAGKSTLAGCLIGLHRPDAGTIALRGRPVRLRSPHDALRLGIAMVHQELSPFPDLTVAENICMGREPLRRLLPGWIDRAAMHRQSRALLARLSSNLPPGRLVKRLSVAEMQLVEIAKALAWNAAVLILDEPTSALAAREAEALFSVIGDLRRAGVAVIYISHKMDEIFRLADTVTVLRDGRHVATHPARDLTESRLISLMLGRTNEECGVNSQLTTHNSQPTSHNPKLTTECYALEVRSLSKRGKFRDISFCVRAGEILGIAGLMGAGRTELVSAIYGLDPADSGKIIVNGRPARVASPAGALARGIALVGEDRRRTGLVPQMAVAHNITLAALARCGLGPLILRRAERRLADTQIGALSIRARREQRVATLSGGNQQKVVLARALLTEPSVLILDEPTRGIDVGAKAEVHALIRELARAGKAVIVVSSELPEILALSDRILVMRAGELAAELEAAAATQEEILRHTLPVADCQ